MHTEASFRRIQLSRAYESLRCLHLDMAIFVLTTTTRTMTIQPITLPLAHARGVIIVRVGITSGSMVTAVHYGH